MMSAELHRDKLHEIVDASTSKILLERLEMLLLATTLAHTDGEQDAANQVSERPTPYQVSIKGKLHKLIDKLSTEDDLEFVRINIESEFEGKDFWEGLTAVERQRIEASLQQANDPTKLISNEEVMEMAKGWITKKK